MDLTTIKGIAKARWWVLVAAAVIAVVVSGNLAEYRNDHLPEYESIASVTFIEDPATQDRGDFEQFLTSQHALAEQVNSDVLDDTPGPFIPWQLAEIHLANDQNQILFIGRGYTQAEADQFTEAMQQRFLAASTIGAGAERMQQELDDLTTQIGDLRTQIATRQQAVPLTEEELSNQARRSAITTQIGSLQAAYGALTVELMNPVLRSAAAVQSEMDRVYNQLVALELELAGMPLPPTPEEAQADDEELLLDQLKLQQLEARWTQLYATVRDIEARAGESPVTPQELTLVPAAPRTQQALSLAVALFAALIGLVAIERGRGIMWADKDLEEGPPVIVELPSRPLSVFHHPTNQPWYIGTPGGRRKAAIQMLRTQLDDNQNAVVAFQGSGVFSRDVRELVADVGVAVAVSGRSVLLIDASYHDDNDLVEYGTDHGATLSSLLVDGSADRETAIIDYKTALLASPEVIHGLRTLRAGGRPGDSADALAGYGFELLMEVARELFDLVLIAGSKADEAASHVLAQRVDSVVLVASAGHTVTRSIEAVDRDFTIRRATLIGVVFLRRRRNRVSRLLGNSARTGLWKAVDGFQDWRHRTFEKSDDSHQIGDLIETEGVDEPDESVS